MRTPEEIAKMLARIAINSRDFAIILTAWRDECIAEATRVYKVVSGEQVAALAERYEAERAAYNEPCRKSEEAPMCTRPDIINCHAKVNTGGRCMNAFQCPPAQQDEGQGGGN